MPSSHLSSEVHVFVRYLVQTFFTDAWYINIFVAVLVVARAVVILMVAILLMTL